MDNNQNQNKNKKNDKRGWLLVLITTLITGYLVFSLFSMASKATTKEISYDEFLTMVDEGQVEEVVIGSDQLTIIPKAKENQIGWEQLFPGAKVTYYTGVVKDDTLTQRLYEQDVKFGSKIPDLLEYHVDNCTSVSADLYFYEFYDEEDVKGRWHYGHW